MSAYGSEVREVEQRMDTLGLGSRLNGTVPLNVMWELGRSRKVFLCARLQMVTRESNTSENNGFNVYIEQSV